MQIRRAIAVCVALVFAAGTPAAFAQDAKREQEKRSKEERQDIEALFKMLEEVESGKQPAPSDIKIDWVRNYFARANDDKTYVPYTVTLDPSAMTNKNAVILLRVVPSQPAETTAATSGGDEERRERDKDDKDKAEYPWEDIYLVDLTSASGPYTLNRAFQVDGGKYTVIMAVRERTAGRRNAPPPKATVMRREIEVPSFRGNELTTSSLFLADNLESVSAPPTRDEQRENPYTFGTLRIHPAQDSQFSKSEQLNLWFWLYGVQPNDQKKPDVTVEFNFHSKLPEGGEKYFNKTAPREFNAQTVPPQFEMTPGFGLPVEFSVPLATFPPGDYRLEIKATDKTSGKTLTRDVLFTVAA
jgi:hypothetical protein